ncbi:MAG: hypothetical protein WC455_08935 [Dehalococcoidia bacterium]|jgi:hypothetical protein
MPKTKEQRYREAVDRKIEAANTYQRSRYPKPWPGERAARAEFNIKDEDESFDGRIRLFFTFSKFGGILP